MAAEYCQQLRESIKSGQPIEIGTLRYIDTCAFWKDQYTKIYQEKKELENKVHRLEEAQRQVQENAQASNHRSVHITPALQPVESHGVVNVVGNEGSRKRPGEFGEDEMEDDGLATLSLQPIDEHFLTMNSYGTYQGRQELRDR